MSTARSARPPPHPVVDANMEDEESSLPDPSSVMATIGVTLVQAVVFMYDFVTYPLYYCAQKPWKQVRKHFYLIQTNGFLDVAFEMGFKKF